MRNALRRIIKQIASSSKFGWDKVAGLFSFAIFCLKYSSIIEAYVDLE